MDTRGSGLRIPRHVVYGPGLIECNFHCFNSRGGSLRKQGVNPYYWKATNQTGHWNHEAHEEVGKYLARTLLPLVTEKPATPSSR